MMGIPDKKTIKEISELMDELNLSEFGYSDGKNSYSLKKKGSNVKHSSSAKTIEKLSNEELERAKNKLDDEQKIVDEVINNIAESTLNLSLGLIKNNKNTINRAKELIENKNWKEIKRRAKIMMAL